MQHPDYHVGLPTILLSIMILIAVLVSGCVQPSEYCSPSEYINLSDVNVYSSNQELPFSFPVDNLTRGQLGAKFATYRYTSSSPNSKEYHAAEDYYQPAGSPVYAMADGIVSYSGSRRGYGWLIIINHPKLNLYSLYGHLSPSRWKIESGSVQKGQLIAYLGDSDENGGSEEDPLTPHLHFGIRSGLRTDYPSMGEWRWSAGWIKYCPQDLEWLQPSKIISEQEIPYDGFHNPESTFFAIWWVELLFSSLLLIGAITLLVITTIKGNPIIVLLSSIAMPFITWYTFNRGFIISYALLVLCIVLVIIVCFKFIRHKNKLTLNKTAD